MSNDLQELNAEYQKLLEDEYEEAVRYASAHGWKSQRVEKGIELRQKISEAQEGSDAVEFIDWGNNNRYYWDHDKQVFVAAWDNYKQYTTPELYSLYRKDKRLPETISLTKEQELREALAELVHLHLCEQEGLLSGKPTPEMWMKAVEKASEALTNKTKIK